MLWKVSWLLVAVTGFVLMHTHAAHATTHEFYKGKTLRIIVGLAAGGGYDLYTRTMARHMGRYIPGNPTVIVENMPGAGSLIAANHLYQIAKPDGLTIGHFSGVLFLGQLLGQKGIEFDSIKFEQVGAPAKIEGACAFTKASGINSIEKWMANKTALKMGATGPGTVGHDITKILIATLGLPVQLVTGYKGTADIRLAVENGELAGLCTGWESLRSTWKRAIDSGDMSVVLQTLPKAHPDLPKVPLAVGFAKTDEARRLMQVGIHDMASLGRPYVLPPATPKDRVQLLRKAFLDTMKDSAFLAEAEKSSLDIDPLSGDEMEKIVAGLFKLEPSLVARLKDALK
jgi:tripartite-type tricarboxylate transporter receptor subunit TctC